MSRPRLLVVEDESVVAKDLQNRLQKLGYDVPVTVATGEEAIKTAKEHLPELILMDIRLKGDMDGVEAAQRIRQDRDVPVIFLTAYADEGTVGRAKVTEPFGYVLKPFQERELHTAIQIALYKHQAEAALRKSERWLSATLRAIGDAVIAVNERCDVVFMNSQAEHLTGYSGRDAGDKSIDDIFRITSAITGAAAINPIQTVIRDGVAGMLAGDTVLISQTGKVIPIEDSASAIVDDDGGITGGVLVFRDVTQRKEAEKALKLSEERFRLLVDGVKDYAIFMLDAQGRVLSWNKGAERLKGYSAEEIIGADYSCFYTEQDRANGKPKHALEQANLLGKYEEIGPRIRKDGAQFTADVVLTSLRDENGELRGFAKVTRDVTERRRTETQSQHMQKLESLGILAGGIAHDFNNLLTGIVGNCSLAIEDGTSSSPTRALLQQVLRAGEKAAELTQQLLSYAGKGEFATRPINLSNLVLQINSLIQTSISKKTTVDLQLDYSIPTIEADPGQIQQVIMNLIINAAESTSDGEGRVCVTTGTARLKRDDFGSMLGGQSLRPGLHVFLKVQDTGCGMDEATIAKIFDPFFTTKFQGRGLGLAALQGIVQRHRGAIRVESQPGEGTTFTVVFPALAHTIVETPPNRVHRELNGTGTILVVDDEEIVRMTAQNTLQHYGYSVLVAEDGKKAVEVFEQHRTEICLVLLDLTMPLMGGEETFEALQRIDPSVRVILSSGYRETEAVQRFASKGLADFIQKPYLGSQLAAQVKKVLAPG